MQKVYVCQRSEVKNKYFRKGQEIGTDCTENDGSL